MLNDRRISELYDFYDTNDCFPDIDLSGGVSYFKWDNTNEGECHVVSHVNGKVSESKRYLKGSLGDSFIRFNEAVAILGKILAIDFQPISKILSAKSIELTR